MKQCQQQDELQAEQLTTGEIAYRRVIQADDQAENVTQK